MTHQALVEELNLHLRSLVLEAKAGSEPARQWLVTSFPGHVAYFLEQWHATDDRPDHPPKRQQQRSDEQ